MKLKHKNYAICVYELFLLVSDNYIDSDALIGLEDFTEFKQMGLKVVASQAERIDWQRSFRDLCKFFSNLQ